VTLLQGAAVYTALINILTFIVYGLDKSAAVKQKQRIPNRVLLGLAAIGGSAGALAGMYTFRHKTQKKYYTITVPLLLILQIAAAVILLSGCSSASYTQISQDEAMKMMQEQSDCLIVDVRRPDEFAEGHIAGAVNVPNETIEDEAPEALPDKEQTLLIYCRSGNRSKEASQKLADMGYTKVYEFGGINNWEGEIVTEEEETVSAEEETVSAEDERTE
jgi:uncharacterized membrane protein YsdA (DUF1294 family)